LRPLIFYILMILAVTAVSLAARFAHLPAGWVAVCSFGAVILAALLMSWSAEAMQFLVSQGLAVALIALLQVLPEFIVEAVIAWRGEVDLMLANATGSTRILMGVGWPMVYGVAAFAHRRKYGRPLRGIHLRPEHSVETWALLIASAYFFVVIAKGSVDLMDSAFLGTMFAAYFFILSRFPPEEETEGDLLKPVVALVRLRRSRVWVLTGLFAFTGGVMIFVAHVFIDAMKEVALSLGISTFIFVQWMAPFLSEFPEKVSAFYWAMRVEPAPMALLNLISSSVNQFTALVAMIPIVYSMGQGKASSIPLDPFHAQEVWLSLAMTIYGTVSLFKRQFRWTNALILFSVWLVQFVFPHELPGIGWDTRWVASWVFIGCAALEVARYFRHIHLIQDWRAIRALMSGKARPAPREEQAVRE
jgi:cation:H+ antiporter